jgi:hypothetical protein
MNALGFYFMPVFSIATSATFLFLLIRMFRRYRHKGFLLLLASSVLQLTYLVSFYAISYMAGRGGDPLPDSIAAAWPYVATLLQVAGLTLFLWGMWSLFDSYGRLVATAKTAGTLGD